MNNTDFKKQLINRAFVFSRKIIVLVDSFPNKRAAWVIADQLLRAATSIGANIIEAQAASSRKDFISALLKTSAFMLKMKARMIHTSQSRGKNVFSAI